MRDGIDAVYIGWLMSRVSRISSEVQLPDLVGCVSDQRNAPNPQKITKQGEKSSANHD